MVAETADNFKIVRPQLLALLTLVSVTILLYFPSANLLAEKWRMGGAFADHGFAIAGLALILFIRQAHLLDNTEPRTAWWAMPMLAVISILWLLGYMADVAAIHTSLLPVLLYGAIFAAFGTRVSSQMAFPVFFLLFALPIWQELQFIFQAITTQMSYFMLNLLGVPALIEGDLVHVPAGTFRIAYGCSGVNFIVVGLAVATFYGHIYFHDFRSKLQLTMAALVLSVVSNWIRVTLIIVIGNSSSMQSSLVENHIGFGWMIFAISLLILMFLANRLEKRESKVKRAPRAREDGVTIHVPSSGIAVAVALLAIGPLWALAADSKYVAGSRADVILPSWGDGWHGPRESGISWHPDFVGVAGEAKGLYTSSSGPVWIYYGIYLDQQQGRELINVGNDVASGLSTIKESSFIEKSASGVPLPVNQVEAESQGQKWLVWYWYEIQGQRESDRVQTKIRQAFATLTGNPEAGATAVATMCIAKCEVAKNRLREFLSAQSADIEWVHSPNQTGTVHD